VSEKFFFTDPICLLRAKNLLLSNVAVSLGSACSSEGVTWLSYRFYVVLFFIMKITEMTYNQLKHLEK